jgi:hypothetical protein
MKAQMQKLGGPLTWVAMHTLFILILELKNIIFFSFYIFSRGNKSSVVYIDVVVLDIIFITSNVI